MFNSIITTITDFQRINNLSQTNIVRQISNLEDITRKLYSDYSYFNNNENILLTKSELNFEIMQKDEKYYKEYSSIIINNKKIFFFKPVVFLVTNTTDGVYFSNSDLNIYAGGENYDIAEKNMYEELLIQWEIYANANDNDLTLTARNIKNNLRSVIDLNA